MKLKKQLIFGFLIFLVGTIGITTNSAFAETDDFDQDGVLDEMDKCPYLKEDNEGKIDGCPSNFVPWYDQDYDGIEDHLDQ